MASLGEFGAAQRELGGEADTFVFCGETFTVQQPMPAMLVLEVGAASSGMYDETQGFAAILRALQISLTKPEIRAADETTILHEADDSAYRKFHELAVNNGVGLEPLLRVVMALFEAQTGRPTQQASGSVPGPAPTSPSSSAFVIPAAQSSHLRSVDDLIRGDSKPVDSDPAWAATVQMGDGQLVQLVPTGQTG